MKDMKRGEYREDFEYRLNFYHEPGGGSSFPCDENGNVLFDRMEEPAVRNYKRCIELGPEHFPVAFKEVEKRVWKWREPDTGVCNCGWRIEIHNEYMGAFECPHCGQWWNLFGQEVNRPDTWRNGDDW